MQRGLLFMGVQYIGADAKGELRAPEATSSSRRSGRPTVTGSRNWTSGAPPPRLEVLSPLLNHPLSYHKLVDLSLSAVFLTTMKGSNSYLVEGFSFESVNAMMVVISRSTSSLRCLSFDEVLYIGLMLSLSGVVHQLQSGSLGHLAGD